MSEAGQGQKEAIQQRLQDALAQKEAGVAQVRQARAELDAILKEEEVQNQAVFYGISPEEARERIEQNEQERASGQPRTIWPVPNQGGA